VNLTAADDGFDAAAARQENPFAILEQFKPGRRR
jgi:hypothetical protein